MPDHRPETRQIHAGYEPDATGALMPPIYANSTFAYETPTELVDDYRYARLADPTRDVLEGLMADLEGAESAHAFASGMAAIDAVLSTLSPGDHVVAGRNLYAETHELLTTEFAEYGVDVTHVDVSDAAAVADATRPETAMVYLETPTNPMLRVADVAAADEAATVVDATLVVDNTFASPALQRPLDLGADVVVESLTKYVGGHSDLLAGAVATSDPTVAADVERTQFVRGAIPGPLASFLAVRGARTLSPRMARHCNNARAIAEFLADHPAVDRVHYPGLESHPNHEVAARQMDDFGGMVSFELAGGRDAAAHVAGHTELLTLAESLGGVESLLEVPAAMTHQDLSAAELEQAGIPPGLVRISAGIEHEADLLADIERALEAA